MWNPFRKQTEADIVSVPAPQSVPVSLSPEEIPLWLNCGHRSSSYATNPYTGVSVCMTCRNKGV